MGGGNCPRSQLRGGGGGGELSQVTAKGVGVGGGQLTADDFCELSQVTVQVSCGKGNLHSKEHMLMDRLHVVMTTEIMATVMTTTEMIMATVMTTVMIMAPVMTTEMIMATVMTAT